MEDDYEVEDERSGEEFIDKQILKLQDIIYDLEIFEEIYVDSGINFHKIIEQLNKFKILLTKDVIQDIKKELR